MMIYFPSAGPGGAGAYVDSLGRVLVSAIEFLQTTGTREVDMRARSRANANLAFSFIHGLDIGVCIPTKLVLHVPLNPSHTLVGRTIPLTCHSSKNKNKGCPLS